ncbi:hypothetical protein AALA36_03870 [Lachnospiraceae bacterium 66-29]
MAQTFILVRSKFFNISIDKEKKKGHNFEEKRREEKRREEKRREDNLFFHRENLRQIR